MALDLQDYQGFVWAANHKGTNVAEKVRVAYGTATQTEFANPRHQQQGLGTPNFKL
jgi:hypothetical protein